MDVPEPGAERKDRIHDDDRKPVAVAEEEAQEAGDAVSQVGKRDLPLEGVALRPSDLLCNLIGPEEVAHESDDAVDTDPDDKQPE